MKKSFLCLAALAAVVVVFVSGCQKNGAGSKREGLAISGATGIIPASASVDTQAAGSGAAPSANAIPPDVAAAFKAAGLPLAKEAIAPVDFSLPLVGGGTQKLSDLKGQVVLLNFWATWCPPCRAEMPSMETAFQQLKEKGFTILAVDLGEKETQVAAFLRENKLTFPSVLDASGQIGSQYGARSIPTTYILDRQGLIVSRMVGSIDWNKPEILAAFETLLGK